DVWNSLPIERLDRSPGLVLGRGRLRAAARDASAAGLPGHELAVQRVRQLGVAQARILVELDRVEHDAGAVETAGATGSTHRLRVRVRDLEVVVLAHVVHVDRSRHRAHQTNAATVRATGTRGVVRTARGVPRPRITAAAG